MNHQPSTVNHSTARARTVGIALTVGFLLFAGAVLYLYYTSPLHILARVELSLFRYRSVALSAAAVVIGALLCFLVSRPPRVSQTVALISVVTLVAGLLAGLLIPGFRRRVMVLLEAAVLFFAAGSLGAFLLARMRVRIRGAAEALAFSGALGLATLSLTFFLLGQVGLFRGWVLALVVLGAGVLGARQIVSHGQRFLAATARTVRAGGLVGASLLVVMCALYLVRLAHCFSPPSLGFLDYDALEYHVAAPLEWLDSGFVSFLGHNAYANMPAATELLYAPGLAFAPDSWSGFHFVRLVGLGASELATLAVFAGARRLAGRRAALSAAALFFCGTWLADITVNPYVEPLLLLMMTACWVAFASALQRGRFDLRRLALAGLLAGAACAAKYPALPLVALPLVPAALLGGLLHRKGIKLSLSGAALLGALALAVAAPWYLRNWIAAGNPVYPLAASVFGSPDWNPRKAAAWKRAHSPPKVGKKGGERPRSLTAALRDAVWGRRGKTVRAQCESLLTGPLLLIFMPLALCGLPRRRNRGAVWIAVFAALFVLGWGWFTHQAPRFLFPAYGGLAILAAVGAAEIPRAWARPLVPGVVLAAVLAGAPAQYRSVRHARGELPLAMLLGTMPEKELETLAPYRALGAVNRLPAGSKVLLVGEARRALFTTPVVYATVWDQHPLVTVLRGARDDAAVLRRLKKLGVTHIFWNWGEVYRLRRSYGYLDLPKDQVTNLQVLERYHLRRLGGWDRAANSNPITARPCREYELWELKPTEVTGAGNEPRPE